jgi:hypothetical protein
MHLPPDPRGNGRGVGTMARVGKARRSIAVGLSLSQGRRKARPFGAHHLTLGGRMTTIGWGAFPFSQPLRENGGWPSFGKGRVSHTHFGTNGHGKMSMRSSLGKRSLCFWGSVENGDSLLGGWGAFPLLDRKLVNNAYCISSPRERGTTRNGMEGISACPRLLEKEVSGRRVICSEPGVAGANGGELVGDNAED